MQVFKRLVSFSTHSPKVIGFAIFVPLIAAALLIAPNASAAGEAYSYAESGAKIVGKGGSFGGAATTFTKTPGQTEGKDKYSGSVKIKGKNGNCDIGLDILVSSGATSGTISAPAYRNGLKGSGVSGANDIPSCDISFAASVADFNKSISISTVSTGNPAPPSTETAAQREIVAMIYSDKKVSSLPTIKITQLKLNTPSTAISNTVDWNKDANIGSARWSNIDPGTYRICVVPDNVFSYFNACQDITKVAGTAAVVNFGSDANVLNEKGKQVAVTVNLSIPAGNEKVTYGPINLTLFNSATKKPAGPTGETLPESLGNGTSRPAQVLVHGAIIDGVEPGTYIVCVTGRADLCSPVFTKEVNTEAKAVINISEDQSKTFLSTDGQSTCAIEGVGWIVCPVTNFLAGISDGAFGVISNFLQVNVQLLDTNNGTYAAWSAFRNIANLAFVVVFLVIIFSQLTGQGMANYGIKKTLPRLVIAAILVNISFLVCQLAVDVTQIIGASLGDFLKNIPVGGAVTDYKPNIGDFMGDVLAGTGVVLLLAGGVAAGASILALSISLPVLLAFLLAVLMTVIILIGRQAGIIILIILSPLAFVAFLLPNTEQWFKKWYKMFAALLLVYPIVALLYGGGALTAKIIANVASSTSGTDQMKFWFSLTAIGVSVIPLIMTPSILKGSMNGMGTIGAKLSGLASKANGRVKSTASTSSRYGEAKQGLKNRFALGRATRRATSSTQNRIDNSRLGQALGLDKGSSRAVKIVEEEFEKEVKDAASTQRTLRLVGEKDKNGATTIEGISDIAITGKHNGKEVSEAARAAAIDRVMAAGGFSDRKAVLVAMASNKNTTSAELRSRAVSAAYAKGDANIYGTSFGDKIVQTDGAINSEADLTNQTVKNAESGSLSAENFVQGEGSARYIVDSVLDSRNAVAKANVQAAAATAKTSAATIPKFNTAIEGEYNKLIAPVQDSAPAPAPVAPAAPAPATVEISDPTWQDWHREQGDAQTVIKVDHSGDASAGVAPAPQSARDSQEQARADIVQQAKQQQASAANRGSYTDSAGRQTPDGASENIHEGMTK